MKNEEFKAAVGKFPTGVTVISTSHEGKLWGFTANSFTSVSLEPSLISFCLDKKASSLPIFRESPYFAINILANDQSDISIHFATRMKDKFSKVKYKIGEFSKSPLIEGAISCIECVKHKQLECGDHYIFIGEVGETHTDETKSPLVYFAKSYTELK